MSKMLAPTWLAQRLLQLGDVHRNPPRLIFGEQLVGRVLPRIDIASAVYGWARGAVVLVSAMTVALSVWARAGGNGGLGRRRRWQLHKYLDDGGRQLDDRTFHLVLTGADLV